jgi:hypothetical protein
MQRNKKYRSTLGREQNQVLLQHKSMSITLKPTCLVLPITARTLSKWVLDSESLHLIHKHAYCWRFTNQHKRDTGHMHNMHCCPQSEHDTAQRHTRLALYFAKHVRDQKLPEIKCKGLIETYSYILCHTEFLGVTVPLGNFKVRTISASGKTGHLRVVTKSVKHWTQTFHYLFSLYEADKMHTMCSVHTLKWNINSLIMIKVYFCAAFQQLQWLLRSCDMVCDNTEQFNRLVLVRIN